MIDPREKLKNELLSLGVNNFNSTVISLDAGSSQCIVDKEYLSDLKIDKNIFNKVYQKVVDFYCGKIDDI